LQMSNSQTLFIGSSKRKLGLLVLGAAVFVALGIWMVSIDSDTAEGTYRSRDAVVVNAIGLAAVVFFGLCGLLGLRQLCNRSAGLTLRPADLYDKSTALAAGFVPCTDVVGIGIYQHQTQHFVAVYVREVDHFANTGNRAQRLARRVNIRL